MIYKYRWLSQALDDMSQEIGYVYSLFGHKAAQRAEARIHDRIIIAIVKLRTASTHCFCRRRCLSAKHRSGTSDMSAVTVLGACDASSSVSLTKTRVWSARPKRTLLRASPSPRRESEALGLKGRFFERLPHQDASLKKACFQTGTADRSPNRALKMADPDINWGVFPVFVFHEYLLQFVNYISSN